MAEIKKRGNTWTVRIDYKDKFGKRKSKSKGGFAKKGLAELYVAELKKKINAKPEETVSFADYFNDWFDIYKKPKVSSITAKRYVYTHDAIEDYFGNTKLVEITRPKYQQFINHYGKNHAKVTVKKVNTLIRSCIKNAIYEEIIRKDFTQNVELTYNISQERTVDYLSIKEIKRLTSYLTNSLNIHFTSKFMILTAILTGARLSEIAALTWSDINIPFKTISINKSWDYQNKDFKPTKNESSKRIIRVNQLLLDNLVLLKNNNSNMIFSNQYGTIPSSSAVNKTLRECLKGLGVNRRGFHFHSLRHSHVSLLLANGIDLYVISKRLGHSDVATTSKIYAYLIDEYRAKSDNQIENTLNNIFERPETIVPHKNAEI